ncbi:MAG: helix-turn-helix transcriptional regulator [Fibrobacter sp.]|nr:helix-turn-helix transcriptional regulator [Fibrobacter sp.]MBR6941485.1 helix-turn-helix transcriptional regulator [Fibrobacter sp.]
MGAKVMENLGKQISERRKKLGLSQEDLAEISGVSPRTINSVELGKANPSINVLNKMVKPLGFVVTLSERVTHE